MEKSQLARLAERFEGKYVKRKPGRGGGDYVSHSVVVERVLEVIGPYSIVNVELIRGDYEVEVRQNNSNSEPKVKQYNNIVVGAIVVVECEVDGKRVMITEVGDAENPHNNKTDGERAKNAVSDAVKRCFMRLGVGLHLWSQEAYGLDERLDEADPDRELTPKEISALKSYAYHKGVSTVESANRLLNRVLGRESEEGIPASWEGITLGQAGLIKEELG